MRLSATNPLKTIRASLVFKVAVVVASSKPQRAFADTPLVDICGYCSEENWPIDVSSDFHVCT